MFLTDLIHGVDYDRFHDSIPDAKFLEDQAKRIRPLLESFAKCLRTCGSAIDNPEVELRLFASHVGMLDYLIYRVSTERKQ